MFVQGFLLLLVVALHGVWSGPGALSAAEPCISVPALHLHKGSWAERMFRVGSRYDLPVMGLEKRLLQGHLLFDPSPLVCDLGILPEGYRLFLVYP